jgi:hypothetical protein
VGDAIEAAVRAARQDEGRRIPIPLGVKLAYTAWMIVWVPLYWRENGPSNFLWLCDFANFGILFALWAESALVASAQLVGVLFIQALWAVDYLGALIFGVHPIGGTEYMFDPTKPYWLRALSLFHLWSVPLLVWTVRRLGYDARGWRLQSGVALVLLPLGQQVGSPDQNLNWMWSPFGLEQKLLPPLVFAFLSVPVAAAILFFGGHLVSRRWLAPPGSMPDQS